MGADEGSTDTEEATSHAPFRSDVERVLRTHGVIPRPGTDARLVREFLRDLYTFELRRTRLLRQEAERILGPQPLAPYRRQVEALKTRYTILALPVDRWC